MSTCSFPEAQPQSGQAGSASDNAICRSAACSDFLGKRIYPLGLLNTSGHATMVGRMFYARWHRSGHQQHQNVYDSNSFLIGDSDFALASG